MQTELGDMFKRVEMLDIVHAWFYAFDKDVEYYVLYLIQNEQLVQRGINDEGDIIGLYSKFTEELNPLKREGTPYTLLDTGEFFKSMETKVLKDSFVIDGTDKTKFVVSIYGDSVIGLTEYNKERLIEMLKENYIKYVKYILQLT